MCIWYASKGQKYTDRGEEDLEEEEEVYLLVVQIPAVLNNWVELNNKGFMSWKIASPPPPNTIFVDGGELDLNAVELSSSALHIEIIIEEG